MEQHAIQVKFFQYIKSLLPPHLSLVDEVAGLLSISNDSAYRRIRGEKPITLDEMQSLAAKYRISIDQFMHLQNDCYIFSGALLGNEEQAFERWLNSVLQQLHMINSFKHKHLYYLAKDVPIMDQFMHHDLFAFKSFLWRRSILLYSDLKGKKFYLKDALPEHAELARQIEQAYLKVPMTQIWNLESINSSIRQIEFYREAEMFGDSDDIGKVYASLLKLIDHLELQAEQGMKFGVGKKAETGTAAYNLFWNDLVTADNTLLAELDENKITFLNHSVINFIYTSDTRFNAFMFTNLQNLVKRSTQISNVGEKERSRFFNSIRDKIRLAARL